MSYPECLLTGTVGRAVVFRSAARREHAWRCWSQLQLFVCWLACAEWAARKSGGMIDTETDAMLRAEKAALDGRMERDLADLARLDKVRDGVHAEWLVDKLRRYLRPRFAGFSVFEDQVRALDELIQLLEARS